MAGAVDPWENAILDQQFSSAAIVIPASWFFALSTTTPTDAGSNITEPVGLGYTRVATVNNAGNFPAAVSGSKSNGAVIQFPTASGSWGTATHCVIYDALVAGNPRFFFPLLIPIGIVSGDAPRIPIAGLTINLD